MGEHKQKGQTQLGGFSPRPQGGVFGLQFPAMAQMPDYGAAAMTRPSMFSAEPQTRSQKIAQGLIDPQSFGYLLGRLALDTIAAKAGGGGITSIQNLKEQRMKNLQDIGMRSVEEEGAMKRAEMLQETEADRIAVQLADLGFKKEKMGPWYEAQTKKLLEPEPLPEGYSPQSKADLEILLEQRKNASDEQIKIIDAEIAKIMAKENPNVNVLANEIMRRTGKSVAESLVMADEAIKKQEEWEKREAEIETVRKAIKRRVGEVRTKKRAAYGQKEAIGMVESVTGPVGNIIKYLRNR